MFGNLRNEVLGRINAFQTDLSKLTFKISHKLEGELRLRKHIVNLKSELSLPGVYLLDQSLFVFMNYLFAYLRRDPD